MTIRVAVVGATGRMGTFVSRLIDSSDDFHVSAKVSSHNSLSMMLNADIVVDVSVPAISPDVVDFAIDNGLNVLVGTSGWTSERIASVIPKAAAAPDVGVLFVPNFSLGAVLATRFAATAAEFFDSIEIVESHGATKIDSPSGTALRTAELMSSQRARAGRTIVTANHTDQRARGQQVAGIPVHSIRMEGIVAKQEVFLGGVGELLTISHETVSAHAYEAGIMLALRGLSGLRGITVGLDSLLGFTPAADTDTHTDTDGAGAGSTGVGGTR